MKKSKKSTELIHPHFVAVRLSDMELDLLDQGCTILGISRSEYLRKLLTNKQIQNHIEIVADIEILRKLVGEYGKIGSNLNQIAKYFNTGGDRSRAIENEIHQCISDLFLLRKQVLKMAVTFMAVLKHIKSRNANYSKAIDYLLFQHDEKTGKKITDDFGRNILRTEFYMDGINCEPMSFDKECEITNSKFHKNHTRSEIKSHHYIISFDPADKTECGLTGQRAQELCLALAKKIFPGHQALVVTHTDGHNESENIHTHIVINSIRKFDTERESYMSQPHDHEAGYKHRSTDKFLNYFKREVMDMCIHEGLHQINLLSPAETKITQAEYMAQKSGQKKLEETNKKIIADGFKPTTTIFQTQKQDLRNAIEECASLSKNFEEFQSHLLEKYGISVIDERDRYRYLHPDRDKRITEKALGTRYGKDYLEQSFLRKDPIQILYICLLHYSSLLLEPIIQCLPEEDPPVLHDVKCPPLTQFLHH